MFNANNCLKGSTWKTCVRTKYKSTQIGPRRNDPHTRWSLCSLSLPGVCGPGFCCPRHTAAMCTAPTRCLSVRTALYPYTTGTPRRASSPTPELLHPWTAGAGLPARGIVFFEVFFKAFLVFQVFNAFRKLWHLFLKGHPGTEWVQKKVEKHIFLDGQCSSDDR